MLNPKNQNQNRESEWTNMAALQGVGLLRFTWKPQSPEVRGQVDHMESNQNIVFFNQMSRSGPN